MTSRYSVNYQLRSHKRDSFIEFIKALLLTPFTLTSTALSTSSTGTDDKRTASFASVFEHVQHLIDDHRNDPINSRLKTFVPSIGTFHTPLPLANAFHYQNAHRNMSARRFVPPSFNDIRRILNTAQVMAVASALKLVTFDGDVTLYDDGADLKKSAPIVEIITDLLKRGVYVAVVTAAGYKDPERYEQRLKGLLEAFETIDSSGVKRFFLVGGECNYLLTCSEDLHFVPIEYTSPLASFSEQQLQSFLDLTEKTLADCIRRMNLPATLIRKDRAVGLIQTQSTSRVIGREHLDECVLTVQSTFKPESNVPPFCAFNGGRDVWVDLGNKLLGVEVLQKKLNVGPGESLHVGDQFLSTGNDFATRSACCTIWVSDPEETVEVMMELKERMNIPN